MQDENSFRKDSIIDIGKIGRAIPPIFVFALLMVSMVGNPLFSGRPAAGAKLYMVTALVGLLGALLYGLLRDQQQRIERLERRIAQITDDSGRR